LLEDSAAGIRTGGGAGPLTDAFGGGGGLGGGGWGVGGWNQHIQKNLFDQSIELKTGTSGAVKT